MIVIHERRPTPEEAAVTSDSERHVSRIAVHAIALSAVGAMPVAGIAGFIVLAVTRSNTIATWITIPAWIAVVLWNARRIAKNWASEERSLAEAVEHNRREMTITIVNVTGIVEAREVLELEDFGPGLLLRTRDNEVIYLAGPVLEAAAPDQDSTPTRPIRKPLMQQRKSSPNVGAGHASC